MIVLVGKREYFHKNHNCLVRFIAREKCLGLLTGDLLYGFCFDTHCVKLSLV